MKFNELGIRSNAIIGKGIEIEDLFDKRILIEKVRIEPTKFPGKNRSGLRMQMQVVLAEFKDPATLKPGEPDYHTDADGKPLGVRRSCFTGSDILIEEIQQAEQSLPAINERLIAEGKPPIKSVYPLDVTIVKIGKCFQFQ